MCPVPQRPSRPPAVLAAGLAGLLCLGAAAGAAQAKQDDWRYTASVASFHLPAADIDSGGRTELTTYHFQAGVRRRAPGSSLGITFSYGRYERGFSGGGFAGMRPWDDARSLALNGAFLVHASKSWSFGIRPFIASFSESGDLENDSLSYGVAIAAVSHWSPDRYLGVGARLINRIDDSLKVLPFVLVNWRLNEQWVLSNPSEPDMIGAAGLELTYEPGERWEIAVLGVYHSPQFRLDDDGLAPGGIGEHEGVMTLARVQHRWATGLAFKGYLGVVLDGALEVRDAEGRIVAESGYDTTPVAGLALERKF